MLMQSLLLICVILEYDGGQITVNAKTRYCVDGIRLSRGVMFTYFLVFTELALVSGGL